ncbi:MAG: hypothetical protein HFE45_11140 [Oscillospiraceae bacterium]|nr:hypothetical protein [Oscillospiraceae bacterium]
MKKFLPFLLLCNLLASCQAGNAPLENRPLGASDGMAASYRIVAGAADGVLLLAGTGEQGGVCRLYTEGVPISWEDADDELQGLRDGMLIAVHYESILETYPGQFGGEVGITVPSASADSLAALYLQVLNDLWEADPGLNEGIAKLAVDLSQTRLSGAEQQAVAWAFYEARRAGADVELVGGTFDELAAEGYLTDISDGGDPLWQWDDGCLFAVMENADGSFTAQKWRSPLGAYYFESCTASQDEAGYYGTYQIGSEAIS